MSRNFVLAAAATLLTAAACDSYDTNPRTAMGEGVDVVKSLHRGELSAVSSYEDALKRNDTSAWAPEMRRIMREHQDAADRLRARVVALKGTPDTTAGPWGGWTELVAKSAAALGDEPARDALKAGERHGVSEYEQALESAKVDSETKALIRDTLIVRAREHVRALESLKQ